MFVQFNQSHQCSLFFVSEIIWGIHPVQEALRGGAAIDRIYIGDGRKGAGIHDIVREAKARGIEVRFEPHERLAKRTQGQANHQGVVAVTVAFEYASLETLLNVAKRRDEPPFLLVLDQIQDPHNFGAILRSAECAGAHGVIIAKRKAAEVTPIVIKAAAGATAYLPICRVTNIAETLEELKQHGLWIIGSSDQAAQTFTAADLTGAIALVIGNEGEGIRRLVAERCDLMVSIPLYGKVSSLNASVASALLAFEVRQQRNHRKFC